MTEIDSSKPLYMRSKAEQTGSIGSAPPSLFEPRVKCAWAKKHLNTLKTEIEWFEKKHPYQIETEIDTEASQYKITVITPDLFQAVPIVMVLGDFAECLRASLDYIAWQLALLSGQWPRRETAFPIVDKYTFDAHQMIAKTTFGIPDSAVAVMKSLQPYQRGDAYLSSHLYRLSTLCNVDKHRHISVYSLVPEWQYCLEGYGGGGQIETEQIDNRTIMRLPLAAKDYVKFNPDKRISIRFSIRPKMDSLETFDISYQDLIDMQEFVADTVIPAFTSFFPQTEIPGEPPQIEFR